MATAPSPAGPFTTVVDATNVTETPAGDFALFVDTNGDGYLLYSANYHMWLQRLDKEYTHPVGPILCVT